jgi:hypothetical protein
MHVLHEERSWPKAQEVYLANYLMTLAAVTDISRHPEIFTLPSADELSQSSTLE